MRRESWLDNMGNFGILLTMTPDSPAPKPPAKPASVYPSGKNGLAVARGAGLVIVRVLGMGNMVTAPTLDEFFEHERKSGYRRFIFDMTHCRGMDSTFMGCMVGMVNALAREALPDHGPGVSDNMQTTDPAPKAEIPVEPDDLDAQPLSPEEALAMLQKHLTNQTKINHGPCVIAVNVSEEVRELMNILGVDKFVRVGGFVELAQLHTAVLPGKEMDRDKRKALVLKAHENLVEIDKRNEVQFGAFLKSLSTELARQKTGEPLTDTKNTSN